MKQGSVTIFFSLLLLLLCSLFFSMVETLRIFEMRLESKSVTRTVTANAFSEYQPYLWENYGILALDAGYGGPDMDIAHVEKRLSDFAWANCSDSKETGGVYLFEIAPEENSVLEYGLLTDASGAGLIQQGAAYARYQVAQGLWENMSDEMQHIQWTEDAPDVEELVENAQKGIEEMAEETEQAQPTDGTEKVPEMEAVPVSEDPLELFWQIKEQGILGLVIGERNISTKTVHIAEPMASRDLWQGTTKSVEPDEMDCLWFDWYVMQQFGHFGSEEKQNCALDYEVEYLIAQKNSDRENLEQVVMRLLAIREVQNLAVILSNPHMMQQSYEIAVAIAGLLANPPLIQMIQVAVVAVWALVESVLDVRILLDGKNVPVMKTEAQWQSRLGHLMDALGNNAESSAEEGLGYEQYLLALVALQSQKKLACGCMDLMEASMHQEEEYAYVRMDNMICTMKILSVYQGEGMFDGFLPMEKLWLPLYQSKCIETISY